MKGKQTVLVVDDEPKIRELMKSYLSMNGFNALCAASGREGMTLFEGHRTDLILLYYEEIENFQSKIVGDTVY